MKPAVRAAFELELREAHDAQRKRDFDGAWVHLERAHILGQRYLLTHLETHLRMWAAARQMRNRRETRGQLIRIVAVVPGYLSGWVPKGNTGGANVSAVRPMPIPPDLAPLLADYDVGRDVLQRLALWATIGVAVTAFIRAVRI